MNLTRVVTLAGLVAVGGIAVLAGCGGGGSTSLPSPAPTVAPSASAAPVAFTNTQTTAVSASGSGTPIPVPLPTGNGFGGSVTLPPPTANTIALVQTRLTNTSPSDPGVPPLATGRAALSARLARDVTFATLVYIRLTTDQTVSLPQAPAFSVLLPAADVAAGYAYFLAYYHADKGAWDLGFEGPGTFSAANTVAFASNDAPFVLAPGQVYWFAVIALPPASATPSPQPSILPPTPVPTVAPSSSAAPGTSPTPVPSVTPQGPIVASTPSVDLGAPGTAAQSLVISETGYTGLFTKTDTCAGTATIAGDGQGPKATYSVTPVAVGKCTVTFGDTFFQKLVVPITVTTIPFAIQ